jgi:FkbM family methyltransferase
MPFGKAIAQSSIQLASRGLVWQKTDVLLSAAGAYLSGLRGLGWSPRTHQEAMMAASWVRSVDDFVVIDAGANVGAWADAFCKHVTGAGRIYAFEPQPEAARKIRERGIDRCEVVQMALGKEPGTLSLYTTGETDSMASLYARNDTFAQNREPTHFNVEVARLDDFVESHHIERIDFMKMDLEGAELAALNGATKCLQSGKLRALSFEFGISDVNARVFFRDLFFLLSGHNYEVFRTTPACRLIPIKEYSEDYEIFARTTTYFARRRT